MRKPTVAVITPCFNEPPERVVPSVSSALHALADQVIVVDDGSAAPPQHVPGSVYVYRQTHRGIAAALNAGRARVNCDYICWNSCGDTMAPDKIERQLEYMIQRGSPASFTSYLSEGRRVDPHPDWREKIWSDNQFCLGTMMVRADVWDAVDGFEEQLLWCQDWDFACRVQQRVGWDWFDRCLTVIGESKHTVRGNEDDLREARQWCRSEVSRRWNKQNRNG